jgi:hypothetical protein
MRTLNRFHSRSDDYTINDCDVEAALTWVYCLGVEHPDISRDVPEYPAKKKGSGSFNLLMLILENESAPFFPFLAASKIKLFEYDATSKGVFIDKEAGGIWLHPDPENPRQTMYADSWSE